MKQDTLYYTFLQEPSLVKDFAFFSANLQHFIPSIAFHHHADLFECLCQQQVCTRLELTKDDLIANLRTTTVEQSAFSEPSIIASFHTGSYHLISRYLAKQGLPHQLVLSTDILNEQGKRYREIMDAISPNCGFDLIDAEQADSLFKIRTAIRNGYHVLIYIDGNAGARNADTSSRTASTINFLNGKLKIRTGVAFLSYLMCCPILPVIPYRNRDGSHAIAIKSKIMPSPNQQREEYISNTMTELYRHLETLLNYDCMQWENWFYVHHDMVLPHNSVEHPPGIIDVQSDQGLPFKIGESAFVLDKKNYQAYPISECQYNVLVNQLASFLTCRS